MIRQLMLRAGVLTACFLLAACIGPASRSTQRASLTVGLGSGPLSLDPARDTSIISLGVFLHLYDTLVTVSPELELQPALAESWRMQGATSWEFRLRPGVRWHNGEPLTAHDVKFSIDRIKDPETRSPLLGFLSAIHSVEAPDAHTVVIHTHETYVPLDRRLSVVGIVPERYLRQAGEEELQKRPVGSGPFRFVEHVRDSHLKLAANAEYWGGAPSIHELTYRFIPDETTRVAALLAGEVDVVNNLPPDRIPEVESRADLHVASVSGLTTQYVSLNTTVPPLDDVRVRRALNHAVNVDAIIRDILGGQARRSSQPLQPGVLGFDPTIPPYAYDPDQARRLLSDAGYPEGFSVVMDTYEGRWVKDKEVMQAIAGDLQKVGVRVEQRFSSYASVFPRYARSELTGMYMTAVLNPMVDPDHPLPLALGSKYIRYYLRPDVEAEIIRSATIAQPAERASVVHGILHTVVSDAPWIFLYDLHDVFGVRSRVDWQPRRDNRMLFMNARLR